METRGVSLQSAIHMPRQTGKIVGAVRREMIDRGFTLVDTPRFFEDEVFVELKKIRMVIPFHGNRW